MPGVVRLTARLPVLSLRSPTHTNPPSPNNLKHQPSIFLATGIVEIACSAADAVRPPTYVKEGLLESGGQQVLWERQEMGGTREKDREREVHELAAFGSRSRVVRSWEVG